MADRQNSTAVTPKHISAGYSRFALLLLTIVFLVHNLDRQIMSILLVPIQNELGASDTAMGFLTGFAFAAVYVSFGIPMAHLCDRGNRRNILSIVIAVWSGFTALCGTAVNYVHLLLMRVGVALGEAGGNPACVSMISDFFPAAQRAMAMGVFYIGASAGIFFGMWLGGWINDAMGWRAAFVVVGLPGVLLALIVRLTLKEPPRGVSDGLAVDSREARSFPDVQRLLWSLSTYRRLILGNACHSIAMYASFAWAAAYFIRIHGLSTTEVGLRIGLVTGLGAALGNLVGGYVTDRLSARDKGWYMGVAGIANLLSVPLVFAFLNLADADWAIYAYLPMIAFMAASAPAVATVTQGIVRPEMRSMSYTTQYMVTSLLGMGGGPFLVGLTNDLLAPQFGELSIRYSMLGVIGTTALICGLTFCWASRSVGRDMDSAAIKAGSGGV